MSINLAKGQKISLKKSDGSALTQVVMGLGWDAIKKKGLFGKLKEQSIDLDASCVLFSEGKEALDVVFFNQLRSKDGSIHHTGDNRTGDGDGDDEQIIVDLSAVSADVKSIVFTVNNYTGQDFSQIENAFCRLVDRSNNEEVARYNLSAQGSHNAQIMAKVYRHNGEWKLHAIGENATGRTFEQLIPSIIPHL